MDHRRPIDRRQLLALGVGLVAGASALPASAARGEAVELVALQAQRADGALLLEFDTRLHLPRAVQDAMQRGVPIYFAARATVWRSRWYWRDERVARVERSWRVAYQPLTSAWRVGLGGLNQHFSTLAEALAGVTRNTQWRVADLAQIDSESRHTIEFSWRLDTSQLPSPMLLGLVGGSEFSIGVERILRLD